MYWSGSHIIQIMTCLANVIRCCTSILDPLCKQKVLLAMGVIKALRYLWCLIPTISLSTLHKVPIHTIAYNRVLGVHHTPVGCHPRTDFFACLHFGHWYQCRLCRGFTSYVAIKCIAGIGWSRFFYTNIRSGIQQGTFSCHIYTAWELIKNSHLVLGKPKK